jgi:prolyl-tRNA synthetase
MVYRITTATSEAICLALVRGDLEVNEVKLAKVTGSSKITPATEADITSIGAVAGYASPYGLKETEGLVVVVDDSVADAGSLVAGGNKVGFHVKGFCPKRDISLSYRVVDITKVKAGDQCALCGGTLAIKRGIEIGNIFQLGDKYTRSMGMTYLDEKDIEKHPLMGCYGIGIGRLMAAVIEDCHDANGPIWPAAVAPFLVHICAFDYRSDAVREAADAIYKALTEAGVDTVIDDSDAKAGSQHANADLIGAPIRVIVAPRGVARGVVEVRTRDGGALEELSVETAAQLLLERVTSCKTA